MAEAPVLGRRDLGKGWVATPMLNNAERIDPHGDDPASVAIRSARDRRRLTALDEGQAWRHRRDLALLVVRVEVFADGDVAEHREAWHRHGPACLSAVWRARWREREVEPGWIEARWAPGEPPAGALADDRADWIVVEDHTGAAETEIVTAYDHVTVWAGRALVTLALRRDHRQDLDDVVERAVAAVDRWSVALDRR